MDCQGLKICWTSLINNETHIRLCFQYLLQARSCRYHEIWNLRPTNAAPKISAVLVYRTWWKDNISFKAPNYSQDISETWRLYIGKKSPQCEIVILHSNICDWMEPRMKLHNDSNGLNTRNKIIVPPLLCNVKINHTVLSSTNYKP